MSELRFGVVRIDAKPRGLVNYALQVNAVPLIPSIKIINSSNVPINGAVLAISSNPQFTLPFTNQVDDISPGASFNIKPVPLYLTADYLAGITESIHSVLSISILLGSEIIARKDYQVRLLAFDECSNLTADASFRAAHVLPSHPDVQTILRNAASVLKEWGKAPAMTGYILQDLNSVLDEVNAIFESVCRLKIAYSAHVGIGKNDGYQKIRMPDEIMRIRMGNCIELSYLFASCIEACGLNPIILIFKDHAMAGVWLKKTSFRNIVTRDISSLTDRMKLGAEDLLVFETTLASEGNNASFLDAVASGQEKIRENPAELICVIDIARARTSGIRSIPSRIVEGNRIILNDELTTKAPLINKLPEKMKVKLESFKEETVTRFIRWERKLLNLTANNPLLNAKEDSNGILRVLCPDPETFCTALSPQSKVTIVARPDEYVSDQRDFDLSMYLTGDNPLLKVLSASLREGILHAPLDETELKRKAGRIVKAAAMEFENSGSVVLYISAGMLRWRDGEQGIFHDAPVLLAPIEMNVAGNRINIKVIRPFEFNDTLRELLLQKYGIRIAGIPSATPANAKEAYLILCEYIRDVPTLAFRQDACIGLFTFDRMALFRDLKESKERINKHTVAGTLFRNESLFGLKLPTCTERPEENLLVPLPADSSQLRAMDAAIKGSSFILHGPPGTGKSQTITNIIANVLASNKKMLFISEKEAAALIIQERMAQIDLAPFCLMAHSPSMKTSDLLASLMAAVNAGPPLKLTNEIETVRNEVASLRSEIDRQKKHLHGERKFGMSLYDLVTDYLNLMDTDDSIRLDESFFNKMNADFLAICQEKLDQMTSAGQLIGHPSVHPLRGVGCSVYEPGLRNKAETALNSYLIALSEVENAANDFIENIRITCPNIDKLIRVAKTAELLWSFLPISMKPGDVRQKTIQALETLDAFDALEKSRVVLSHEAGRDVLDMDGRELNRAWKEAESSHIAFAQMKKMLIRKQLLSYRGLKNLNDRQISNFFIMLEEHTLLHEKYKELQAVVDPTYSGLSRTKLIAVNKLVDLLETLLGSDSSERLIIKAASENDTKQKARALLAAVNVAETTGSVVVGLLSAAPIFKEGAQFSDCLDAARRWNGEDALDGLRAWCQWNKAAISAKAIGLGSVVTAYCNGLPHHEVKRAFLRAAYGMLLNEISKKPHQGDAFSGDDLSRLVKAYAEKYEEYILHCRYHIRMAVWQRLAETLNECSERGSPLYHEMAALKKAVACGGRGYTVRSILSMIPTLLSRLKPCLLMSPTTAAQTLTADMPEFDLLVYDEASQIPTCRSVMSMARGKAVVIAGDPLQMPPSNLFAALPVDEEHPEAEDLESILDDCLAISLPEICLNWHYRSSHESLIAFSNSAFYGNSINTFPSSDDQRSRVSLRQVDGIYDRGKTRQNEKEAEQVSDEVFRRLEAGDSRSIGIITFNLEQAALIQQKLDAGLTDRNLREFSEKLNGGLPIFVKSIEFVQGDERDVILLSLGYGPDKQGHIYMTFGPLSIQRGQRRLNVALTRSKEEMVVFTSLYPENIKSSDATGQGVAALKSFLEFARTAKLSDPILDDKNRTDSMAELISREIRTQGYECHLGVGRSSYKVDIAVCDPNDKCRYLLGIHVNGRSYASNDAVYDREVGQLNMLKSRGWHLMHIWPIDWYEDKRREMSRILSELRRIT